MRVAIVILFTLLIIGALICLSICMVCVARVEQLDNRMRDLELRVNNLAEGMILTHKEVRKVAEERLIKNAQSVSPEQVDEARKRAKL